MAAELLRWLAYGVLALSALLIGLSIFRFSKGRQATYYAIRRKALEQANQRLRAGLAVLGLGLLLLIVAPRLTVPSSPSPATPRPVPETTIPPTLTADPVPPTGITTPQASSDSLYPTHTPTPTPPPMPSPTRRPTAVPPVIPTSTPTAVSPGAATSTSPVPLPDPALSPIPSAVPAGQNARIDLQCLAMEKDDNSLPVDPANVFPPGDHWVYLFFTYEGMQNGVARTFAWYRDGEYLERCSDAGLWEWGDRGRTWYRCAGTWQPGTYEIRVFIETRLQGVAQFVITES